MGLQVVGVAGVERLVVQQAQAEGQGVAGGGAHPRGLHAAHQERVRRLLVRNAPRLLAEGHRAHVELLNVVDGANRQHVLRRHRQAVREAGAVEAAHVVHLPQVYVAEHQLLVEAVHHRRSVACSKGVQLALAAEGAQRDGLRADGQLLHVPQRRRRERVHHKRAQLPVPKAGQQVGGAIKGGQQHRPGDGIRRQLLHGETRQSGQAEQHQGVVPQPGHSDSGWLCGHQAVAVHAADLVLQMLVRHLVQGALAHLQVHQVPAADAQQQLVAVRHGDGDGRPRRRVPGRRLLPGGRVGKHHRAGGDLQQLVARRVGAQQRLGGALKAGHIDLVQLVLGVDGQHPGLADEGDHQQRVVHVRLLGAQRPHALDAGQLHRSLLVDAHAAADDP